MPILHHHHYHQPPAIVMQVTEERPVPLTPKLRQEYERLYTTQIIRSKRLAEIAQNIDKIEVGWDRYTIVSDRTGVPWYIVGILHLLECDCRFDCHLHNGDPLKYRTHNEPSGRPIKGNPPFTWEASAVDALQYEGFDVWADWGISGTLYKLETYNGFGSRNHGIATPYLWAGTTFYKMGKYVADSKWDPRAVSSQIGAAPILRTMTQKGLIEFPPSTSDSVK